MIGNEREVAKSWLIDSNLSLENKILALRVSVPSLRFDPGPQGSKDMAVIIPGNTNGLPPPGNTGLLNQLFDNSRTHGVTIASSLPHQERNGDSPKKMEDDNERAEAQQRVNVLLAVAGQHVDPEGIITIYAKSIGSIMTARWLSSQNKELREHVRLVVLGYPKSMDKELIVLNTGCRQTVIVQGREDKFGTPDAIQQSLNESSDNIKVFGVSGGHSYDDAGEAEIMKLVKNDWNQTSQSDE